MSIAKQLQGKIQKMDAGSVFCAQDFSGIASQGNIDVILHRLAKGGDIRQLGHGLYDKPIKSKILGLLKPDISKVIQAYIRRTGYVVILDPKGAANALNMTTQVPAQLTYFTNGKSQIMNIDGAYIKFIHATPKKLVGVDTSVGLLIQALYYFGSSMAPKNLLEKVAKSLTKKDIILLNKLKHNTMRYITSQIDRIISYASA